MSGLIGRNYLDIVAGILYTVGTEEGTSMKYITVTEAAALKGVSRSAIYLAVQDGRIPHTMMLGRIALKEKDVEAYTPIPNEERQGVLVGGRPKKTDAPAKRPVGRPKVSG
jgi:excisionase family DNA binding protein